MIKSYDALVIGAGPAGATAALLLARAGWSVGIVEKAMFPRRKVCGEFISATSLPLLRELGVADSFIAQAGPAIRQVGLYSGNTMLAADMPGAGNGSEPYGRALGREHLDALILDRAAAAGAAVLQPWTVTQITRNEATFTGSAVAQATGEIAQLRAHIVIAAHGSWERGALPTQQLRHVPRTADLFAFKAHFKNSRLPSALMPLVAFPGGYGGMVQSDDGRTSLSCCIRRDYLEQCRRRWKNEKAAAAVLSHIQASCRGVREALSGAMRDGVWLSAGPIRPGIRRSCSDGIFMVGNAAGEAHPIVAEGISMAIQSAWLLCERLIAHQNVLISTHDVERVGHDYAASWRKNFARRIYTAAAFAHLAMRPVTAELACSLLQRAPMMLTLGAYLSGKAQSLSGSRGL